MIFPLSGRRIYVAGDRGMVGQALIRRLAREDCQILTAPRSIDLREQASVRGWFADNAPEAVIIAAARVGGIKANDSRPAEFLYDNLMIEANLIEAARQQQCAKLLFLGSSCIYPRMAPQPIAEESLMTGPLEPTNQWYAAAKIAGIMLCQAYRRQYGCDFISAMPTNLYGPGDNYDLDGSHVIPALIRKTAAAQAAGDETVVVWGTGKPLREFMHVDDLADACVFLLRNYSDESHVNVGSGQEISIADLAALIAGIAGFGGRMEFDTTKPDGTPRKIMDGTRLQAMGWMPSISLRDGLIDALRDYRARFE
ncbi:MAG: GDP-fucose synthetase [Croceicoccus sp.]|nr:GDP-fucose synthetase [Croceicoccus sp.]MAL27190.1 GDP-fucose synthetase [Croceicoccus sp.]|tara:strand:- start:14544 stop:15476 length:933 start_codon:yes stop_codon:yes gene_type:complete